MQGYILETQVGHLIRRAHQRSCALFAQRVGNGSLTSRQFAVLVKLREMGRVSQNELGRLVAMDPATVQGVLRRLEARGLVDSRSDPDDHRRRLHSLTGKGRALLDDRLPQAEVLTEELLAPLSAEERETFVSLLRKVV